MTPEKDPEAEKKSRLESLRKKYGTAGLTIEQIARRKEGSRSLGDIYEPSEISVWQPMLATYFDHGKASIKLNFVMRPCRQWLVAAAKGGSHAVVVGLALWEMAGYEKSYLFKVNNWLIKQYGPVYFANRRRTLMKLESMGLIRRTPVRGRGTAVQLMIHPDWSVEKSAADDCNVVEKHKEIYDDED